MKCKGMVVENMYAIMKCIVRMVQRPVLVLLLCMLAPMNVAIESVKYTFSPNWKVVLSSTALTPIEASLVDGNDNYYYILNNGSQDILSQNKHFALCFYDDSVYLMMQNNISEGFAAAAPLVWLTNITYHRFGSELNYTDIFWNSVELYDNGTVRFYNKENTVIDSYGYESTALLPNSSLQSGMSLISMNDEYYLEVTPGGLILRTHYNMLYYVWSVSVAGEATEDHVRISECKGFEAVLHYNGTDLYLAYEPTSPALSSDSSCRVPPRWIWKSDVQNLTLPFLRLNGDGNLVSYAYNQQSSRWIEEYMFSNGKLDSFCKLPAACSRTSFGTRACVCDAVQGTCNHNDTVYCPNYYDYDYDLCKTNLTYHIDGVSFISLRFLKPNETGGRLEDCKSKCYRSCACYGIVYNKLTHDCFLIDDIGKYTCPLSFLYKDNATQFMSAFFRVRISSEATAHGVLWRIAVGLAPMLLFAIAICCLAIVNFKLKNSKTTVAKEIELMLATTPGLPQRYSYTALDTATKGFGTKLGAGGFGSVYEGYTTDGKHIAVKKLEHCTNTASSRQFVTELAGTGGISHLNIVKLYGFCIEGATQRLLVYEFMPNGSLDRWLFGTDLSLTWEQRVSIALGTARGLAYLHEECSEPILHLDVKPQNILLDENFVVKVADFGMAKLLANRDVTQVQTGVRGTPGYVAPEWLLRNIATKKCDVYSYGMVLLELIGGRRNISYEKVNDDEADPSWYFPAWAVNEVKQGNLAAVVDERVREKVSPWEMRKMIFLALWCIQDNPSARPSMHVIVGILEGRLEVDEPPYSFHFDVEARARSTRSISSTLTLETEMTTLLR